MNLISIKSVEILHKLNQTFYITRWRKEEKKFQSTQFKKKLDVNISDINDHKGQTHRA